MIILFNFIANTQLNETIKILGNRAELGEWDLKKGVVLETNSQIYPVWNKKVELNS